MATSQISVTDAFIALFRTLPEEIQEQVRKELTTKVHHRTWKNPFENITNKKLKKSKSKSKEKEKIKEFQKFLLSWPVMTDEEYNYIQEKRKHLNEWK